MRKALVTGGAGFIGTNVADRLLTDGVRVRILDNLARAGVEENLAWLQSVHGDRLEVELADIRDTDVVQRSVRDVDAVFHFAAAVGVKLIVESPVRTIETNVRGTEVVLAVANKKKKRVLVASTSPRPTRSTAA